MYESCNDILTLLDFLELCGVFLALLGKDWAFFHPDARSFGKLAATTGHELNDNHFLQLLAVGEEKIVFDALVKVIHVSRLENIPVCEDGLQHGLRLLFNPTLITKGLGRCLLVDDFLAKDSMHLLDTA